MLFRVFREDTRIHNIKPNHDWRFDDLVFRGLQDIVKSFPDMKKLQKPKTLRVLCVVFRSLKKTRKSVCASFTTVCNSSLTYTTYKPSHRSHTIIPLSNHHTIIILKSIELRNIWYVLRPQCVTVRSPRLALRLSLSPNKTVSYLPIVEVQLFFHLGLIVLFLTFLCT